MSNILDLPPELRMRIVSQLFAFHIPDSFPKNKAFKGHAQKAEPNNQNWLVKQYFCFSQSKLSPNADAPEWRTSKRQDAFDLSGNYRGIFTVNKQLRNEALDVYYSMTLVKLQENERLFKAFPSKYGIASRLRSYDQVGHLLHRVRNCEISFDVESARDMLRLPSRLEILLDAMNVARMQYLRVEIRFVKLHLRKDGMRVLGWGGSKNGEQKSVGSAVWARFTGEMRDIDLKRFAKGKEHWHEVFVWVTWRMAEKGLDQFEALGRVIGAEVRSSNGGVAPRSLAQVQAGAAV